MSRCMKYKALTREGPMGLEVVLSAMRYLSVVIRVDYKYLRYRWAKLQKYERRERPLGVFWINKNQNKFWFLNIYNSLIGEIKWWVYIHLL